MASEIAITRRESLKMMMRLSGGLAFSGIMTATIQRPLAALAEMEKAGFLIEGVGQTEGYSVKALIREMVDVAGGISAFVSTGDVVAIKPNISWARPPHLAANTNPAVLEAVIELCQEAGAGRVIVADNTIQDARRCFALSGAGTVAKKTGADLVYPNASLMRDMKLRGDRLDVWPVFAPIVEADKLINLPVAKHHVLTKVTLGMKNWMGAIGGKRGTLHGDIDQVIVDLAQFFKPTITLIDATRIMIRNGPSGGSPSNVAVRNELFLSDDQVAADARAAQLFDRRPEDMEYITLAQKNGIGTYDLRRLTQERIIL